ncbi:phosphate ABC transporter ATP-binding protein [Archaeoglobus neptunius]|uniref:phosphate ABC transporter ATP-binding protein n=1 Tax=Archaeoglobus neptunius TaxID=2798580 RepID=UPI0019279D8E
MSAIEIRNLNIYYGRNHVIKSVNFRIPENVVFAIMGPSGCGKSTLLRAINRLLELQDSVRIEGDIKLYGKSVFSMNPIDVRRRVGMVFQQVNPFPHLNIYENVAVGLRLNGIPRSKLKERVVWALEKAALWDEVKDRLYDFPTNLSGGQQQRLCIARALALKPEVLLMDEPTANLDPIATEKIEDLIYELKKEYTVVIVTHSPSQAARISDYVAFLYMGELIEVGKTEKVFEKPEKELTERYLTGRIG